MTRPPCLKAAFSYLEQGWSPITLCPPDHKNVSDTHTKYCTKPGKCPLWPWKEYQDRLPRSSELELYWARNAAANVGIALGPVSGLLALDIDGLPGEQLLKKLSNDQQIRTLEFTSGLGRRLFFEWPKQEIKIKSLTEMGFEAIRILAKGSQTVAPPSIHANGHRYAWKHNQGPGQIVPLPCPDWLLELSKVPLADDQGGGEGWEVVESTTVPNAMTRAIAYLAACSPCIVGMSPSAHLFKLCTKLVHGFGLDAEQAFKALNSGFNQRCKNADGSCYPWSTTELVHKILDAINKGSAPQMITTNGTYTQKEPKEEQKESPRISSFDQITQKPVEWLWHGYLPLGKVTILDGDPGLGKSTMLLDLAARVSTSGVMPDGTQGKQGSVLVMSAEDGPEDTIKPRLIELGADEQHVHFFEGLTGEKGELRLAEIPEDMKVIESILKERTISLLIIDPLMAFLGSVDANKDQSARKALYRLSKTAERCQCVIVCMRHLNKGSGTKAIYRGNSSIAFIGHARVGLLVAVDPEDEDRRILAVTKSNLTKLPPSLAFSLKPQPNGICQVHWDGQAGYKADELVVQNTPEQTEQKKDDKVKLSETKILLNEALEDGPKEVAQVKKDLTEMGYGKRTIERAAKELGLKISQKMENGKKKYIWAL